MPTDQKQLAVQAHLTEFSALRQELLDALKWRDGLIFVSLGTTGALFSFAFSSNSHTACQEPSRQAALYLVAPLATIIGGLWLSNAWRTYRISKYIREVLSTKLNTLIAPPNLGNAADFEVFKWESSGQRIEREWMRRVLDLGVLLGAFVLAGVAAQYVIISAYPGSLIARLGEIEHPAWFELNCLFVLSSFVLFTGHFVAGRMYTRSSTIWGR